MRQAATAAQHAPFDAPKMLGVLSDVSLAVAADDVGEFERRRRVGTAYSGGVTSSESRSSGLAVPAIKRPVESVGVARRRRKLIVTQQDLDYANIGSALQKMCGEAVPQHMHADALVDPGCRCGGPAGRVQHGRLDRLVWRAPGKQIPALAASTANSCAER